MNTLSAQVGDKITFVDSLGVKKQSIVAEALWVGTDKGGKVWSYRVVDGDVIANDYVLEIDRIETPTADFVSDEFLRPSPFEGLSTMELASAIIEDSDELPSVIKTAVMCLIDGDLKSLETARFLVNNRIKQVLNMQIDEAPCLAITKEK